METLSTTEPEQNGKSSSSTCSSHKVDPTSSDSPIVSDNHDDVCLVLGEEEIICRKELLIEHSRYFRAMFASSMKESTSERVDMKGLSATSFKSLLHFMETGEITLDSDSVHSLVEAACMLQVESALKVSCSFLISDLDNTNCLSSMLLADTYFLNEVYNSARRHAIWYFKDVMKQDEFLELDRKHLMDYLSDRMLNVDNDELNVLRSVDLWVSYDAAVRRNYIKELLGCVHFENIPPNKLITWAKDNKTEGLVDLALEAGKRVVPVETQFYRRIPEMILSIGGNLVTDEAIVPVTDITRFDSEIGRFVPYTDLGEVFPSLGEDPGYDACVLGNDVYITGGEAFLGQNTWLMSVWCFHSFKQKWDVVTRLTQPRRHHGMCVFGNSFYLIGGFGRYRTILKSFEQYDVKTDEWTTLPPLLTRVTSPGVTVHEQKIYVVQTSIQCYDVRTKMWTVIELCPSLCAEFKHLLCGDTLTVGGSIYVCNAYGPHFTILDTTADDFNAGDVYFFPNAHGKAVVMNEKLYRDGGVTCNKLECYDPAKKKFEIVGTRDHYIQRNKLLVLPYYPNFR